MSRERAGHTLQTTAILNEAYLRLVDSTKPVWQGRRHFIAAAAQIMRHIMVDHARERQSLKRGGGTLKVTLDEAASYRKREGRKYLLSMKRWKGWPRRTAQRSDRRVALLRWFVGRRDGELLKLSQRTVEREWTMAKAWLYRELSEEES